MAYKRILLPSDGSPLSSAALRAGAEFAKDLNAEILGLYVAPEYSLLFYGEGGRIPSNYMTEDDYKDRARLAGENYFKEVRDAASNAGLKFSCNTMFSESPAACIV